MSTFGLCGHPPGALISRQGRWAVVAYLRLRVSPELHARVKARAKAEGKTISQVVRELIEAYVTEEETAPPGTILTVASRTLRFRPAHFPFQRP